MTGASESSCVCVIFLCVCKGSQTIWTAGRTAQHSDVQGWGSEGVGSSVEGWGALRWRVGAKLRKTSAKTLHSLAMCKHTQGKVEAMVALFGWVGGRVCVNGNLGCERNACRQICTQAVCTQPRHSGDIYRHSTTTGVGGGERRPLEAKAVVGPTPTSTRVVPGGGASVLPASVRVCF